MMGASTSTWTATERVRILVSSQTWPLGPGVLDQINQYWSSLTRDHPHFFRGPVLAVAQVGPVRDEATQIETHFTDFAHFLFSRRHLAPGHPEHVKIITACAWLITNDGWAIVGLTHPESAKPEVIQPIGGSPSPDDILGGFFDPVAGATRELTEETGLTVNRGQVRGFTQLANGSIAIAVRFDLPWTWDQVSGPIRQHLSRSAEPELADVLAMRPGTTSDRIRGFRVLQSVQDFLLAPELS